MRKRFVVVAARFLTDTAQFCQTLYVEDYAMLSKVARLTLPVAVLLLCSGCRLGSLSFNYYDDHHHRHRHRRHVTRVYVDPGHVCSYGCHDHYWDGTHVVVLSGHHHGPGCGHFWDGAYWVVRKSRTRRVHSPPVKVTRITHVHGPSCGHVYHHLKRKWISIRKGHIHGPHCGHVFIEGRWTIRF